MDAWTYTVMYMTCRNPFWPVPLLDDKKYDCNDKKKICNLQTANIFKAQSDAKRVLFLK